MIGWDRWAGLRVESMGWDWVGPGGRGLGQDGWGQMWAWLGLKGAWPQPGWKQGIEWVWPKMEGEWPKVEGAWPNWLDCGWGPVLQIWRWAWPEGSGGVA